MRVVLPAVARHGLDGDQMSPTVWQPSRASEGIVRAVAEAEEMGDSVDASRLSTYPCSPVPLPATTGVFAWLAEDQRLIQQLTARRSTQL